MLHGAAPAPARQAEALTFAGGMLTLNIEERQRLELRNNNRDFDRSVDDVRDDEWMVNRFRFGLSIRPSRFFTIYAQAQDTREWFSKRGSTPGVNGSEGGDSFDLRQLYSEIGDVKSFPLTLTVGRQPLNYGDNRLVADAKWNNFGRTFDGVKLHLEARGFWADAFAARVVQIRRDAVNDSDSADQFFGLYAGSEVLRFQTTEWYFLFRDKADNQPDLAPANRLDPAGSSNGNAQRIATVGTRWKSLPDGLRGFDYSAEFSFQFGDVWNGSRSAPRLAHRAYTLAVTAGYTWSEAPWTPRLGLEYDYATGDRDPADRTSQTFQNLFPSNHAKFGAIDLIGWRNMRNLRASLKVQPSHALSVVLDYHALWLANASDYAYSSNGNSTLRNVTSEQRPRDVRTVGASDFLGHEVDLIANWVVNRHLTVLTGYSHFFAGGYLRDTGNHDDADFGYLQGTLSF